MSSLGVLVDFAGSSMALGLVNKVDDRSGAACRL